MAITRIRVPAHWWDLEARDRTFREEIATFELGKGQCGLTVTELFCEVLPGGAVMVRQRTAEGEHKDFIYPFNRLQGRVEVSYDG